MTASSKKIYFDVLDNIIDKFSNTYHNTIKMEPTDLESNSYPEYTLIKQVIMLELQSTKTFFLEDMLLIGQKKFSQLAKLKILYHGNMLYSIQMLKELLELFMKKNCRRQIKKGVEQKK